VVHRLILEIALVRGFSEFDSGWCWAVLGSSGQDFCHPMCHVGELRGRTSNVGEDHSDGWRHIIDMRTYVLDDSLTPASSGDRFVGSLRPDRQTER
jgi:hypothetical protein